MASRSSQVGTVRSETDQVVEGQHKSFHMGEQHVGQFNNGDAIPRVQDVECWICGASVVTITDFLFGQNGQTIRLLGNANTTITNGTKIKTNTGANKVLANNKVYSFTRFNDTWYEAE